MRKHCVRCRESKPISEFALNGTRYKSYCTLCWAAYQRDFRKKNPDKHRQYKISEKLALEAKVDVVLTTHCRLCGYKDPRALVVDHVDNTGGLERKGCTRSKLFLYRKVLKNPGHYQRLCCNCNQIKETERARAAYLKKYPRPSVPREAQA